MPESLKLEQRASVGFIWAQMECKCHSESHTKKSSAGTRPPQSCGVNSGCVTKAMPQTLPLLHRATGSKVLGSLPEPPSCVWKQDCLFSSWMELVPGHCFARIGQELCPEASEKGPFASWDDQTTPLSYCFVYLISQKVLRNQESSRKYDF